MPAPLTDAQEGVTVLTITDQAVDSLRTVMEAATPPVAGVRLTAGVPLDEWDATCPVLQLMAVTTVDMEDELLIAGDGIPLFVEPAIAAFLEGTQLDSIPGGPSPTFLLEYEVLLEHEETIDGPPSADAPTGDPAPGHAERWRRR